MAPTRDAVLNYEGHETLNNVVQNMPHWNMHDIVLRGVFHVITWLNILQPRRFSKCHPQT